MTTVTETSPRSEPRPCGPGSPLSGPQVSAALATKIAQVTGAVRAVARDGRNTHFNFSYSTADAVFDAVRVPMADAKLALTPMLAGPPETIRELKGQNSTRYLMRQAVWLTLTDGDTGDQMTVWWLGEAADAESSGISKAITNAERTFLRALFLLPQAEDTGPQRRGARGRQSAAGGQSAQPETIDSAAYHEIVAAYQKAGNPVDPFSLWLGEQGHPIEDAEEIAHVVAKLTAGQGVAALEFLRGLGEPITSGAAATPAEAGDPS